MADRLPDGVREAVYLRDGNACVLCSRPATNVHHRQPAQHRAGDHSPWNLLSLCGSGSTGHHGWIETHRAWGTHLGLLVPQTASSANESRVFTRHGWRQLYNDGLLWGPPQPYGRSLHYACDLEDAWLDAGHPREQSGYSQVSTVLTRELYRSGVAVFHVAESWQRVQALRDFTDAPTDARLLWVLGVTTALQRYSEELGDLIHHRSVAA